MRAEEEQPPLILTLLDHLRRSMRAKVSSAHNECTCKSSVQMARQFSLLSVTFAVFVIARVSHSQRGLEDESREYTNSWAVKVRGARAEANFVARRHGFENLGLVCKLEYIFNSVM